jgi:hypothetical protein
VAHSKLSNVDYRVAFALGMGGILGAQIGPHLLVHISTASFKKIFAFILLGLAAYLFLQK